MSRVLIGQIDPGDQPRWRNKRRLFLPQKRRGKEQDVNDEEGNETDISCDDISRNLLTPTPTGLVEYCVSVSYDGVYPIRSESLISTENVGSNEN
jgi:hypothetical protein